MKKKSLLILFISIILTVNAFSMPKKFGSHFNSWLKSHGYGGAFPYGGVGGGADAPKVQKTPVIFIHGNGSMAWGQMGDTKGWRTVYAYLKNKGFNKTELYAVNWQNKSFALSAFNDHSTERINIVKRFIKAVHAYTGKKVSVISHSMGVTLARKAMADGNLYNKVKTFIAIAGANHGLKRCAFNFFGKLKCKTVPTCSKSTGLCPAPGSFVHRLNEADNQMQGKPTRTYVLRSRRDRVCVPVSSALLKGAHKVLTFNKLSHWNVKNKTAKHQYKCLMWEY